MSLRSTTARRLKPRDIHAAGVFTSQVCQSGTTFCITTTLAHCTSPAQFGKLSVIIIALVIMSSLNRAALAEQFLLFAKDSSTHNESFAQGYRVFQIFLTLLASLAGLAVVLALRPSAAALLCMVALTVHMASDGIRYSYLASSDRADVADDSFSTACLRRYPPFLVDGIRVFVALGALTLIVIYPSCAIFAGVAALLAGWVWLLIGLTDVTYRNAGSDLRRYFSELGSFEVAMVVQTGLGTVASQLLPVSAVTLYGAAGLGGLRFTQSLLNPVSILFLAIQPVIIMRARGLTPRAAKRFLGKALLSFFFVAVLAFILLLALRSPVEQILVPASYRGSVAEFWIPVSLAALAVLVAIPGGALLRAFRLGAVSLTGQILGIVTGYVVITLALATKSAELVPWAVVATAWGSVLCTYIALILALSQRSRSTRGTVCD